MHISISGQQMEVSTALREHVTKKMNCISHHFAPVTNGRVGLHVGKIATESTLQSLLTVPSYMPQHPQWVCMRKLAVLRTNYIARSSSAKKQSVITIGVKA